MVASQITRISVRLVDVSITRSGLALELKYDDGAPDQERYVDATRLQGHLVLEYEFPGVGIGSSSTQCLNAGAKQANRFSPGCLLWRPSVRDEILQCCDYGRSVGLDKGGECSRPAVPRANLRFINGGRRRVDGCRVLIVHAFLYITTASELKGSHT